MSNASSSFAFSPTRNLSNYTDLDKYFEIQRYENEAAKFIQKTWRRTRVLLPWRKAALCQRKAVLIQKRLRGMLTRKYVAEWFYRRNKIVIGWQAHSRRFVINRHTRVQLRLEQDMVIQIQRIVRGKLARLRCENLLWDMAATRIQILWRGVVARAHCDKIWLFRKTVIPIQNIYRKTLAIKKFKILKEETNEAALVIQKKFRNWTSCKKLGNALFAREMGYRMDSIRMLTSEEELCQEKLSKLMDRLIKNNSKAKAVAALKAQTKVEEEVYRRENDLIEVKRQMDIISPRAMEAGFLEECEKNAIEIREQLTASKIKFLFEASAEVFRCDEFLEEQVREIEEWAFERNRVAACRQQEYEERLHLNYQRDTNLRRREKRIAIAEEKRRWQVLYYTRDGKPDKNRRPGRPWTESVYAGPEKAVYSGGVGVDLLANTRKTKKTGSVKSVDNTINQISLQTYLDEVQLYEHLLDPLTSIMQNTMGGGGPVGPAGAGQSLSQRGWGPEGDKMEPALAGIGALPDDWAEQQRRHRKNDFTSSSSSPGTALNTARQQGSAFNSAYNSANNSGDNTARSALSSNSYNSSASRPRSILRKKSAYGTAGSSMGNSRHSTAKKSILVSRMETIHDDFSSVQSDSLFSGGGGDGQLDEPLSSLAFDTSKFEEFSSVADMFQHSSRVRRKNAKKVTYLPTQESFSSSYRNNIRNISAGNFATQVARGIEQSVRLDVSGGGTRGGVSPARRVGSSSSTPLGAYTGNTSGVTSPTRSTGGEMSFSRSMPLVPPLSHMSDMVPVMSNTTTTRSAAASTLRTSREAAAAKKKASRERERNSSTIPWELLDSLDGERTRFNNERAHIDFHSKLK